MTDTLTGTGKRSMRFGLKSRGLLRQSTNAVGISRPHTRSDQLDATPQTTPGGEEGRRVGDKSHADPAWTEVSWLMFGEENRNESGASRVNHHSFP